ncbi:CPBP family intramembrane glutamic endopeptidase [Sorangium sp. So ce887]|uniref:CPBP family intramembrane glutamic endopeptidase n=1 Tax=Sorangium sp. So ce887 TaxID=3133324 RepID=UPI003F5EB04F
MSAVANGGTGDAQVGGLAGHWIGRQHTVPLSVALHLVPGVLIGAAYMLVAAPVADALGYPPLLGIVVAMSLALVPAELGLLLYLGWKKNGRPSLEGVVLYRGSPTRRGVLVALVAALLVWTFAVGASLAPLDFWLLERLFFWVPERYFVGVGGTGEFLAGHASSVAVTTLLVSLVLSGLILPVVEELYFRGYLLPRLSHLGRWAPVLNMVLFALYHLWSPWQVLSRICYFLPTVWATWRKEDLRISLWVHCLANTASHLLMLAAVLGSSSVPGVS